VVTRHIAFTAGAECGESRCRPDPIGKRPRGRVRRVEGALPGRVTRRLEREIDTIVDEPHGSIATQKVGTPSVQAPEVRLIAGVRDFALLEADLAARQRSIKGIWKGNA